MKSKKLLNQNILTQNHKTHTKFPRFVNNQYRIAIPDIPQDHIIFPNNIREVQK